MCYISRAERNSHQYKDKISSDKWLGHKQSPIIVRGHKTDVDLNKTTLLLMRIRTAFHNRVQMKYALQNQVKTSGHCSICTSTNLARL